MMKAAKVRIYSSGTDFRRCSKEIKVLQLCLSKKEYVFIHVLTKVIRKEYIADRIVLLELMVYRKRSRDLVNPATEP